MVNGVSGYSYYNKALLNNQNHNKSNRVLNDGSCETVSSIAFKGGSAETISSVAYSGGSAETISSVAFKANAAQIVKNTTTKNASALKKFPKKVLALIAGALGLGVAVKQKETKTIENVQFKEVDKLTEYKTKYPELAEALSGYDVFPTKYNDIEKPHYSRVAKLVIFETFEKDPQKAYDLAQKLKYDKSEELSPEVLDAVMNSYDELKKYPSKNFLEDSYHKMEIVKQNPLMQDLAKLSIKVESYYPPHEVDAIDLEKYSEFCTDKESAAALFEVVSRDLGRSTHSSKNSANDNIAYAKLYQKYPNMPDVIKDKLIRTKFTPKLEATVEKYLSSSNVENFADYVEEYGFEGVDELLKYHTVASGALRLAKSHCKDIEDVKSLTKKIIMTEELFDRIEKDARTEDRVPYLAEAIKLKTLLDTSKVMLSQTPELAKFIENMDLDKKNLFLRMIEDGRCGSIQQMTELLPVYKKYPNTQITGEMINKFNDPLARAMGLC